ncbi:MAG: hypothetical protein HY738_20975 [Bacteroidia bacterium]|nr:hypothetical protein [Bacteroidia bacterium]
MKNIFLAVIIQAVLIPGIFLISCKQPESPVGIVTVTIKNNNSSESPADGAYVRIVPTVNVTDEDKQVGRIYKKDESVVNRWETQTDASGHATFEFKYPCIMKVFAWQFWGNDSVVGEGVLVLREDETAEEVIKIEEPD